MRRMRLTTAGVMLALMSPQLVSGDPPRAVSPGSDRVMTATEDRCPTFSWAGTEDAESYELMVYALGDPALAPSSLTRGAPHFDLSNMELVLRQTLPGRATSWTPSAERCLELGVGYAWTVRAERKNEVGEWSEIRLFQVDTMPTVSEVRRALGMLKAFLARRDSAEEAVGAGLEELLPDAVLAGEGAARRPDQREPEPVLNPFGLPAGFNVQNANSNAANITLTYTGSITDTEAHPAGALLAEVSGPDVDGSGGVAVATRNTMPGGAHIRSYIGSTTVFMVQNAETIDEVNVTTQGSFTASGKLEADNMPPGSGGVQKFSTHVSQPAEGRIETSIPLVQAGDTYLQWTLLQLVNPFWPTGGCVADGVPVLNGIPNDNWIGSVEMSASEQYGQLVVVGAATFSENATNVPIETWSLTNCAIENATQMVEVASPGQQ